jgi:hypothetical protein
MTKDAHVTLQELIRKAKDLARIHGHIDAKPSNDGPSPRRTPPDGVGGFHITFGSDYVPGTENTIKDTYVKIFQGGDQVFEAVFFTGREHDPHKLFVKFDPDNDWRMSFMILDNLSPSIEETIGSQTESPTGPQAN